MCPVVIDCPYEGAVKPQVVAQVAHQLQQMGCYEISLGDTIGIGTPLQAKKMVEAVAKKVLFQNLPCTFMIHEDRHWQIFMPVLNLVCLLLIHLWLVWEVVHMHMVQAAM